MFFSQCHHFFSFIVVSAFLCFVQYLFFLEISSYVSQRIDESLPKFPQRVFSTKLNCTVKLKCPNNITRFSIHIDKNEQYPNVSYVRSPVFSNILDTIRNSSYYTNDSALACIHIAPVDTIDRDRRSKNGHFIYFIEQRLHFFSEWTDSSKIHLIFNHYTGTWPSYRRNLDFQLPHRYILASTSFTYDNYNCPSHVTYPLYHSYYQSNFTREKIPSQREFLLSFKGKSYEDVQHHRTLFHFLNNDRDIIIRYTDKHHDVYDSHDYIELLRQSYFCLVPSGRRLYSYRFLEALQYGCIPVITTNNDEKIIPPFSEIINWSKCLIIYIDSPVTLLPYYLRHISQDQRREMQIECLRIWSLYFSSTKQIILTLLNILNDRFVSLS